jgi:NTE family protein
MRRGLVLEGGGAKGAWQFGVLQAFAKNGLHFDVVSGTSVGLLGAMKPTFCG